MNDCVFCKIIKKEIPAHVVYEDSDFLAFLTIHPDSAGQTLVIPKEHHRWVWDVADLGAYFGIARKIARAQQKAFDQEAIWIEVKGDEVPHAHVSVLPHPKTKGEKMDFEGNAEKIIANLK